MFQNDQAGSFRTSFPEMSVSPVIVRGRVVTGEPGLHIGVNLSRSRSVRGGVRGESPILGAEYKAEPSARLAVTIARCALTLDSR